MESSDGSKFDSLHKIAYYLGREFFVYHLCGGISIDKEESLQG